MTRQYEKNISSTEKLSINILQNMKRPTIMKQVVYITTILMLLSCNQSTNSEKSNQTSINEKTVNGQVEINSQTTDITETDNKENNPVDVALTFINSYANNCNKMKEAIGIIEWVNSNELSTNSFKTEVKRIIEEARKEDPELGLGFDPIFDAQDFDNEFVLETFDSNTNFIVVKGKDWQEFKVIIKVVKEGDKWLVDGCGIINIPKDKQRES